MPDKDKEPTCVWEYKEFFNAWDISCSTSLKFYTEQKEHILSSLKDTCPYCGKRLEVKDEHSTH